MKTTLFVDFISGMIQEIIICRKVILSLREPARVGVTINLDF